MGSLCPLCCTGARRSGPDQLRRGPRLSLYLQLHSGTDQPPQEPSHQREMARSGVERKEMGPPCSLPLASSQGGWARGSFRWMQRASSEEGGRVPAPPPSAHFWGHFALGCFPGHWCDMLIGLTSCSLDRRSSQQWREAPVLGSASLPHSFIDSFNKHVSTYSVPSTGHIKNNLALEEFMV